MPCKWKLFWLKTVTWIVAEIALNLIGTDSLADYSEYIFAQEVHISRSSYPVL